MAKKSSSVSKVMKAAGKRKPKPLGKQAKSKISTRTAANLSKEKTNELLTRARELAWAGQHAKAIELASQELSRSGLKPDIQMDLLDLRAESQIAQLNLDAAEKDTALMVQLAKAEKKLALKAQALIRKGVVQWNQNKNESAIKILTSALKIARQSKQKHLEAETLFRLADSQIGEKAIKSAQLATDLFTSLANPFRIGRALAILANSYRFAGQHEEARRAAQTALTICEQTGDNLGKSRALNVLATAEIDLSLALKLLKQSDRASEASGYLRGLASSSNNLGYTYSELGLYPRAIRFYRKSLEVMPSFVYPLSNMIHVEIELNDLDLARQHVIELGSLSRDQNIQAFTEEILGRIALIEDNPKVAVRHFKNAVQISYEAGLVREIGELALMGQAYLAQRRVIAALKATSRAAKLHRALGFPRVDDHPSQNIWWRHAEVLQANKKTKEAGEALEIAYHFLLKGIANIRDEGIRRNYLNKVAINREIIQAWLKDGAKRKLPKERLFAHLAIESSLREPFERLADTGLRMNALRTAQELYEFLVEEATELSGGERVLLILEKDGKLEVADSLLPRGEDAAKVLSSISKYLARARLTRTVQLILPRKAQAAVPGGARSRVVAPLIAQNQIIGYLYTDIDSLYGTFDETDRDMFGMLANQAAVALENAGLLEGLERKVEERTEQLNARVDELAILNTVGEAMAKTLDVKTVTKIVGDKVRDIFNADVSIKLLDQQTKLIHTAYEFDKGEGGYVYYLEPPFPLGKGLTSKIIQTRKPLLLGSLDEQTANGAYMSPEALTNSSGVIAPSFLGAPIIVGDKVLGTVNLSVYQPNAFNENHLSLLQTLSSNMGVAIENARLFEAEQQRVAELAIINSIQQGLASKLDFNEIFELVGEKLHEVFPRFDIAAGHYDSETDLVTLSYMVERGKRLRATPFKVGNRGFIGKLIRTRKTILVNENVEAEAERLDSYIIEDSEMPKSCVYTPLLINDEVRGVIVLMEMEREHAISEADVRLFETITSSMSVALENARLFKAEQDRVAELAVINSVQEGLAKQLDLQGIVDLIGEKVGEIFTADTAVATLYDPERDWSYKSYYMDHGKLTRFPEGPALRPSLGAVVVDSRRPLLLGTSHESEKLGALKIASADAEVDRNESYLGVPILAGEKVIGLIAVQSYKQNAYTESDVRLLQTLANAMSVALQNAQSFKAEQERVAELQIINSIQQGLAAELDFQAIVDLVGDKLREVFNTPDLGISWYDEKANLIHYLYAYEHGKRQTISPRPPALGGVCEIEIKTRQPVVLNTAADYAKIGGGPLPGTDQSKSGVAVPIISSDHFLGDISIENYERENAFGESELRLLTTIAASLGTALENARLFDETQRLLKITEERNAELAIINSVQAALAAELNIQGIYDAVGDKIREIFHNKDVSILIYDPQTKLLHFPYVFESGERIAIESRYLPDAGFSSHVVRTRETIVINENIEEEEKKYGSAVIPGTKSEKSKIIVPLVAGDQTRGMITLDDYENEHAFSDSDVRLLQTLANSMSVALENARLFDETQRLLKETEQRNAELAIINSLQAALAAELNIQGIYDAVGDKIREIFRNTDMNIRVYDPKTNLVHFPYSYEKGERLFIDSEPAGDNGFGSHVLRTRESLVINENMAQEMEKYGSYLLPGTQAEKSAVFVPLVAGDQARGLINLVNMESEHAFSDSDVRLLQTLANSMSVALENARLFDETQRLLKETEQRAAELAIINTVQEGLVAKMDMQGIYDLVGDKIRNIFDTQVLLIAIFDHHQEISYAPYVVEKGKRLPVESGPFSALERYVIRTRQMLVFNERTAEQAQELWGEFNVPVGEAPKSMLVMPLIVGDQVKGIISLQNVDRENAFSDSDVRLLTTLANSMSVALENARLFDETQRLLKETEQRNAELAIINSVQEGLASKLDMQVIYDLVGDKIQEIFDAQVVTINTLDTRNNLSIMEYGVELGKRLELSPSPFSGLEQSIARTRQTILINQDAERRMAELGAITVPGTAFTKSNVFVPMMVGDDLKGYVSLQNVDRENAFSESDVRLLQTLANSMSVALENARLFDETQRLFKAEQQRSAELQIINSVQEGLARKLDLQEIIDLVGEKIGEIFAADTVSVGMYDPERDWVSNRYYIDRGQRIPFPEGPPIRPSLTAMMVDTHKPLLIGTSEESRKLGAVRIPREGEELDKNEAFLGVPILANNRAIGAVSIQSYKQNAFNQNDLRLLQTLANSMSVALENARLFDETQRLLKETEQRAAELAIINSVQEGLASKLDMQSIYDLVGNKIRDIFDAQTAFIATINHQTKMVHTPYYIEKGERFYLQPRPYPDLVKYLIGTRQPILIKENWHESLKVLGIKSIKLPGEPSKSGVFVPLIAGNEVIGLISLQNVEHTNAFTESDMRLLQTLANSMSVALENARLFDETQRLLKETEQRAQELSVINSVQEGLASKLDMQAIYNLVGDKIRNIFDAQVVAITVFDHEKQTRRMIYAFENGQRISDEELRPFNQLAQHLMTTRRPVIMNENAVEVAQQHGMIIVPGTEAPKSIIIVPFGTAQQINGYFSLQNIDREHAFSESDVRLLQTLAGSMGIALENARLFEAERQRAAELAAISTVSQALVAETELENMIQLIGSQMREIFKADIVYVALLDKQTNLIHFPYQFGEAFVTLNFGEGLTSKIIETGEPLLINKDIGERRAQLGKLLVGKESLSFLGVPIKSGRESIGVLSVQNTTAEGVFNDDDLHLLTTIAANAGAAIHTAQLHAETQRRAQEMATLAEIGSDIAATRELEPVLEKIAAHAKSILRVRDIAIRLLDTDGQTLYTSVALGAYGGN